ncbi:MAG: protein kinase [Gammaproteobacteria bacterium]|nr:protein kinase [Gammaproteobacteria bacterium]
MISGYEILETFATRASTKVYRARDVRIGKEVALKVIEVQDEESRARSRNLLDCANELRKHPHPNICRVLDVGQEGNRTYVAYERLRSFGLLQGLNNGMSLVQIKKIFVGLALALQHLEKIEIVHGDIKPENILLRDNGEPVLIDVSGGSVASGDLKPTTVTAGYGSPESVRGDSIDARSDLYSLAISLYRTISGDIPWKDTTGEGRTSTDEDIVPRLAIEYEALQPAIDSFLAFTPSDRILNVEMLESAFDEVVATSVSPSLHVRSDLVRSEELAVVNRSRDGRVASGLASFSSRRRAVYFGLTSIGPIVLIAGMWIGFVERHAIQEFFSGLGIVEHPEFEERWRTAEALNSDPNQTLSAITAAYNRVLEIAPNHQGTRAAIDRVRDSRKNQISQFIESNDLTLAQSRLNELARVYPSDEDIDELSQKLYQTRRADRLLDDTRRLQELRGIEDQEALTAIIRAYKQLVLFHPDLPEGEEAQSQLNMLSKSIAEMSLDATKRGNLPLARDLLGLAVEANPASADLRSAQEELDQAQSEQEKIEETLQIAATRRENGNLVTPKDQNAYASFKKVLELDPENQVAINGLDEVETNVILRVRELLDQRRLDDVVELIESARTQGVSQESQRELEKLHLEELGRISQAEILYEEAVELFDQGFITRPNRGSALFKLSEAQSLDPHNGLVGSLIDQCLSRVATVARDAYLAGMEEDARRYLNVALSAETPNVEWEAWRNAWFPNEAPATSHSENLEDQSAGTADSIGQ